MAVSGKEQGVFVAWNHLSLLLPLLIVLFSALRIAVRPSEGKLGSCLPRVLSCCNLPEPHSLEKQVQSELMDFGNPVSTILSE